MLPLRPQLRELAWETQIFVLDPPSRSPDGDRLRRMKDLVAQPRLAGLRIEDQSSIVDLVAQPRLAGLRIEDQSSIVDLVAQPRFAGLRV
jgi:hypothetical protein